MSSLSGSAASRQAVRSAGRAGRAADRAALPALGLTRPLDERVGWGLLALPLMVGGPSLGRAAWRERRTRSRQGVPTGLFAAGVALLAGARPEVDTQAETPLVVAGAALVGAAHLANRCRGRVVGEHAGTQPAGRSPHAH